MAATVGAGEAAGTTLIANRGPAQAQVTGLVQVKAGANKWEGASASECEQAGWEGSGKHKCRQASASVNTGGQEGQVQTRVVSANDGGRVMVGVGAVATAALAVAAAATPIPSIRIFFFVFFFEIFSILFYAPSSNLIGTHLTPQKLWCGMYPYL